MAVYESQLSSPTGPKISLQPLATTTPDYSAIGDAAAKAGAVGVDFAAKLAHAKDVTQDAAIKTEYLQGVQKLSQQYGESDDFNNAVGAFETDHEQLKKDLLAKVPDPNGRTRLGLYFQVHGQTIDKQVRTNALNKEADFNVASLNERSAEYVRRAAAAGSDEERNAVFQQWNADIDEQVGAGWITRQNGVQRKVTGQQTVDDAGALALIRINPKAAIEALDNPENFKGLNPIQRENLKTQARAQQDQVATLGVQNLAKRDPVRAVGLVGRVGGATEADGVFERGILPIEGGLDKDGNALVSRKGAIGLTQIIPDTARANARRMGLTDIAALDDAALVERLKTDHALNKALGLNEWRSLVARYDGRVYVAAAAYNAGPGNAEKPRADAWAAEAERKFGPAFTAEQFASVIPIEETRNYVLNLAKKLGVPANGAGLSIVGTYHAAAAVSSALAGEERDRVAAIKDVARIYRDSDPIAKVFEAGLNVAPARYAAYRQAQLDAAGNGDVEAAKALREVEFQRELLPFRQQALRTPPAELERVVAGEELRLRGQPSVTIDEKNRLDVLRETLKSVHGARKDNIIGLAEQGGFVAEGQRAALDAKADFADRGFGQALMLRGQQAAIAARFYDGRAVAFKPEELAAFKQRFTEGTPDEQFKLLDAMGRNLSGRAFDDTLAALTSNGRMQTIGQMVGRIAVDNPELAREILVGAKLMDTKEIGDKGAAVRTALSEKIGGMLWPDPDMQNGVVHAALAVYTARRGGSAALYDPTDATGIEKAIEDVAGKIGKVNGLRVAAPRNMSPAQFSDALDRLDERALTLFGGAYGRDARPFDAAFLRSHAQLLQLHPGSDLYEVMVPIADGKTAPVLTYDGTPLIINPRLIPPRDPASLTPYQRGRMAERERGVQALRDARAEGEAAP